MKKPKLFFFWVLCVGLQALGSQSYAADVLIPSMASVPATGVVNGSTFIENIEVTTLQGNGDSLNVNLSYTPPPGTTVQSVSISSDLAAPPARSCNIAVNPVTCSLATVRDRPAPAVDGEFVTLAFTLKVSDPSITSTTVLTHSATVTATADSNNGNNTSTNNTTIIPGADVRLNNNSYISAPASGIAGAPVNFVITPENFGPNTATNFQVQTTLTGASPGSVSGSGSGWSCGAYSAPDILCTFSGSVASGASAPALTITTTPGSTGTLTADASVLATGATPADPDTTNNGVATRAVPIGADADLAITNLSVPASVALATPFNYTFTAGNNGPSNAATNTVSIPIPSGTTVNSITATGWSCSPSPPRTNPSTASINCTRATFNNGASTNFTVNTTINNAGSKLLNPSISSSTADSNLSNNSQSTPVVPGNDADLAVTKSASLSNAFRGDSFSYTISAQNNGPATVLGTNAIQLIDNLPANVRLTAISQSGGTASGFTWSCSPSLPVDGPAPITCTANAGATVDNGETMPTLTFNVQAIGPTASTTRVNTTNQAVISSNLADPTAGNNTATDTVRLYSNTGDGSDGPGRTAAIRIVHKEDFENSSFNKDLPEPVGLNQTFYYRLRVRNNTTGSFFNLTAGTLTVTDTLPAGLTLVNAAGAASDGWSCSPTSGSGPLSISCTRDLSSDPLPNGTDTDIRLEVFGTATGTRTNNATVAYSGYDVGGNNSANENTTIANPIVDLTISKSDSPDPVNATGLLTYTIAVTNSPCATCTMNTANVVRVVDELNNVFDADFSATFVNGASSGSCTVTDTGGSASNRNKRVVCDIGDLPYNSAATVTIQVRPRNTGTRTNNAFAYTPNPSRNYFDPTTVSNGSDPSYVRDGTTGAVGYNKATTTTTIAAGADVRIQKTVNPGSGRGGTPFVFNLNVRNNGPSQATNLVVTDTLPTFGALNSSQGFEFTGTSPFSSGGYNCTYAAGSDPNPNIGGTITCTRATLNNNSESTISFPVRPTNFVGSTIAVDNTGTVTSTSFDGIVSNNSNVSTAGIQEAQADLVIVKTDRPQSRDPAVVTDSYFYTLRITNNGPSRAQDVVVTDTLPTETGGSGLLASFASATADQGSCSPPSAGILTCNLGNLEVNASTTVTVTMNADNPGTVNNSATVSSVRSVDPVSANDKEDEGTTLRDPADLILTKTANPSPVSALQLLTYTLTVTNDPAAPGTAFESYVRDTLPLGAQFISATPSQGSCLQQPASNAVITSGNQTLNCRLGTLTPGASATITVVLRAPNAVTTLTNSAIVNDVPTLNSEGLDYDAERDLTDNAATVVTEVIGYGIYGSVYQDLEPNGTKDSAEDWAAGVTVYVKLTRRINNVCQSPAIDVQQVDPGVGAFGFPLPPPTDPANPGNIVDSYCLILDDNTTLSDITPNTPPNWVITEPSSNIGQRFVVLGLGPTTLQDFGLYQQDATAASIKGRVFEDNGLGTTAHDGIQGTQEFGISGLYVSARQTDCNGTILDQTYTDNNGGFEFFVPAGSPVAICAATPNGYISVSENIGNSPASNTNVFDSATVFTPVSGQNYSGLLFGKVGRPAFVASQSKTSVPGATEFYPHIFTAYTEGQVTFSVNEIVTNNQIGWNSLLYQDTNCDAELQPSEPLLTAAVPVSPDDDLVICIINKVLVPATTGYGSQHRAAITANFAYQGIALSDDLEVVDLTTISDGAEAGSDVNLVKSVQKRAPDCAGSNLIAAATAYPGECLVYTLEYINQGTDPINDLKIFDATPSFTTFVSATCGTLGTGLSQCTIVSQPAVGAIGGVEWNFSGDLQGSAQGDVTYEVKIDE